MADPAIAMQSSFMRHTGVSIVQSKGIQSSESDDWQMPENLRP